MNIRKVSAIALVLMSCRTVNAADLSATGPATAHDGDDLLINGQDYRLSGIDAFESGQTCNSGTEVAIDCGSKAKEALSIIVEGKQVTCRDIGERAGKRVVAICSVARLDIQEEMVRIGWAFVRPDFAGSRTARLCTLEAEAASARRGAWALNFKLPYFVKGGKNKTREQVSCQHAYSPT